MGSILDINERKYITDTIRKRLNLVADESNLSINNILEFKKLNIMLNIYETFGREFERQMPFNNHFLFVKLSPNKKDVFVSITSNPILSSEIIIK